MRKRRFLFLRPEARIIDVGSWMSKLIESNLDAVTDVACVKGIFLEDAVAENVLHRYHEHNGTLRHLV